MTRKGYNITSSVFKPVSDLIQKLKPFFFLWHQVTNENGNGNLYIKDIKDIKGTASLGNNSSLIKSSKKDEVAHHMSATGKSSYNSILCVTKPPSRYKEKHIQGKRSRKKAPERVFKLDLTSANNNLFLSSNCILCHKETTPLPNGSVCERHSYCIRMDIKARIMVDMISVCYTIVAFDQQKNDVSQYLIDLVRNQGEANRIEQNSSKKIGVVEDGDSSDEYFSWMSTVLQDATITAIQSIERKMQQGERKSVIPENVFVALIAAELLLNVNSIRAVSRSVENRFKVFIADKSNKNGKFLRTCQQLLTNKNTKEDYPRYIMVSTEIFDEALRTAARQLSPDEPIVMYEHVLVGNPVDGDRTEELAYIIYHPDDCRLFIFIPTLSGSYLDVKDRIRRNGSEVHNSQ